MLLTSRPRTVYRGDEGAQRLPKGALGSLDRRNGRLHALRRAHVPLGRQPVHDRARVRLALPLVQEDRVQLRDPDDRVPRRALRERHRALRVLPRVRQGLAPPLQQHAQGLGDVGRDHRGELGGRVRHCGGDTVLLGLAVVDVLAVRYVLSFFFSSSLPRVPFSNPGAD